MIRLEFPFLLLLVFGCASAPTPRYEHEAAATLRLPLAADWGPAAASADPLAAPFGSEIGEHGASLDPAGYWEALDPQTAPPPPPPRMPPKFFSIKGGYYSLEDTDALDDGYIINASFTQRVSENFSSEIEIGYLDASGKVAGSSTDLWGIPFMANARLSIPVSIFEIYGGIGIGTIYYDFEGGVVSADGFLAAGNGFFGASAILGGSFALGLEGKYYVTDNISDLGGGLDAYAGMVTLSFLR